MTPRLSRRDMRVAATDLAVSALVLVRQHIALDDDEVAREGLWRITQAQAYASTAAVLLQLAADQ